MDRDAVNAVLATPLAQELVHASLAHVAYIGRDGYPRVIPTGSITPEWAKLIDFETTLPQAVEELLA